MKPIKQSIIRTACAVALAAILSVAAFATEMVQSITTNPGTVVGGYSLNCVVTLRSDIPNPGTFVAILSQDPSKVSVPNGVFIPAGAKGIVFQATTHGGTAFPISPMIEVFSDVMTYVVGPHIYQPINIVPPSILKVGVSPSSFTGGGSATGTVYLNGIAPSGGYTTTLQNSAPAGFVGMPGSVTFATGATTATFPITSNIVSANTPVLVTAVAGNMSSSATTFTLLAPTISGITVPTSTKGGSNALIGVSLKSPAPAGGLSISILGGGAVADGNLFIGGGASSGTISLGTSIVNSDTTVAIHAVSGGQDVTKNTIVTAPTVRTLTLLPTSVINGKVSVGTITMSSPCNGGMTINLSSNNAAADPGMSVQMAGGATTATFNISSGSVTANTVCAITASTAAGSPKTANLTVKTSALTKFDVTNAPFGGLAAHAVVTLDSPAPFGGVTVNLTSSDTAVINPNATVIIPEGTTSVTFDIPTFAVVTQQTPTVTASFGGVSKLKVVTVKTAQPASVTLNPSTVGGGLTSTGTVTLTSPAPVGGMTVNLDTAMHTTATTNAATIVIPEGETTGDFTITTSITTNTKTVLVTAGIGAYHASATLTVFKYIPITLTAVNVPLGPPLETSLQMSAQTTGSPQQGDTLDLTVVGSDPNLVPNQTVTITYLGGPSGWIGHLHVNAQPVFGSPVPVFVTFTLNGSSVSTVVLVWAS